MENTDDWSSFFRGVLNKGVDAAIAKDQRRDQSPVPIFGTYGAADVPGQDGLPIRAPINPLWIAGGVVVLLGVVLLATRRQG